LARFTFYEKVMNDPQLFLALIGCTPPGRHTEQHDVFAGIGSSIGALVPAMQAFWPEAQGKLHLDAWRAVRQVDGYVVRLYPKGNAPEAGKERLWFINLGGYQTGWFEELHYKMLLVASSKAEAVNKAKKTLFYKENNLPGGGESHIDDQWLMEADEVLQVAEMLPTADAARWDIRLEPATLPAADDLHIGYFKLSKLI
jgi:hypothetical protein